MDNNKNPSSSSSSSSVEENVNPNPNNSRTPFTNLSQIDADLALARTLQDQERAYMLLTRNGNGDVSDDESWETGSYNDDDDYNNSEEYEDDEEQEDDVGSGQPDVQDNNNNQLELDPSSFPDDEAYARALQDAEDQEMAARLFALTGIHQMATEEEEDDEIDDQGVHSQNLEIFHIEDNT
nr:hypothetical protein [Tanacetum cinerariifolium]